MGEELPGKTEADGERMSRGPEPTPTKSTISAEEKGEKLDSCGIKSHRAEDRTLAKVFHLRR